MFKRNHHTAPVLDGDSDDHEVAEDGDLDTYVDAEIVKAEDIRIKVSVSLSRSVNVSVSIKVSLSQGQCIPITSIALMSRSV